MEFGLFQQQTTKLIMTTSLRQAISLLQYNTNELTQFLYEKSLENPLIELKERSRVKGKEFHFDQYSETKTSLSHHLITQLGERKISPHIKKVILFLIDSLTRAGFLEETEEELSELVDTSVADVQLAKKILQTFDPIGVGARDIQESLLIQIRKDGGTTKLIEEIITHHFDLFLRKSYRKISQHIGVIEEDVRKASQYILQFDPQPGRSFNDEKTIYIKPELKIKKENGQYVVSITGSELPRVQLCPLYEEWKSMNDECNVKYLHEKMQEFQWLIQSLDYRQQTLITVANIIVKEQIGFLENGSLFLKPLTLGHLAYELGVHESTVSRAIRNKYIQTPFGVYELKYFFSGKIESLNGDLVSNKSVKEIIRRIIEEEDKRKPYSDQKIVQLLEEQYGYQIARRTVTKYREEQCIPSSQQRKMV